MRVVHGSFSTLVNTLVKACVLTFFGLSSVSLFGQAEIWYVGNNVLMDFSAGGDPTVSTGIDLGALSSHYESTTAISDANGDLIFAVAGNDLYDGGQNVAQSLGSKVWDVAQGTLVFPVPGSSNDYYLTVLGHSKTGSSPMSNYYRVNTTGTTGAGNITVGSSQNLSNNLTQAQAGVPKLNVDGSVSDDYWLLTHEVCNNNFKLFSVTSAGINLDRTIGAGPSLTCSAPVFDQIGVIKFNSCYTQFAYTIGGTVMLFDFDANSGDITFLDSDNTIVQPYGVEFSKNSDYLYIYRGQDNNNAGTIYRYDVSGNNLAGYTTLGATGGSRGGHLQLAPDGNIYYPIPAGNPNYGTGKIGRLKNADAGGIMDNNFYTARAPINWPPPLYVGEATMMDMPNFLRSFVSSIASLKIDGADASDTDVCQGKTVEFTVEIEGSQTPGVVWVASGANSKTQNGGSAFQVTMTNPGLTTIEVTVTDDCGRSRTLDFEVEVNAVENASATVSSTCPRIATGFGASSNNYKWYDADPSSGGNLIGIGSNYDATAYEGGAIWVEPAGNLNSINITDNRTANAYGAANQFTTNLTVPSGVSSIDEFSIGYYSDSPAINGDFVIELRDASNNRVGTPVSKTITRPSGGGSWNAVFNPGDWIITEGNYTVVITSSPSGAQLGSLSQNSYSNNGVVISGGRSRRFRITINEETTSASCGSGTQVNIPLCCTAPIVTTEPTNETTCEGTDQSFSVAATPSSAGSLSYQWFVSTDGGSSYTAVSNGANYSGSTTPSFTVISPTSAIKVYAQIDEDGAGCFAYSDTVDLTVNPSPSAITGYSGPTAICPDDNGVVFSVDNDAAVDYAWNYTGTGATITGGTTNSISIDFSSATPGDIEVTATAKNGCGSVNLSQTISLGNAPQGTPSIAGASGICESATETYTVSGVTGADSYNWTVTGGATLASASTTGTTNDVTAGSSDFDITVTPENGCGTGTPLTYSVTINSPTVIDTEPTDVSTCAGQPVSFTVGATGSGTLSYQWYKGALGSGSAVSGATGSTLSFAGVAVADAGLYYVEVTGDCGTESSVAAELSITSTEFPGVTVIVDQSTICENGTVTFTATGSGTGSAPTYRFLDASDNSPLTGGTQTTVSATQETYTTGALTSDLAVVVELTSNSSCIDGSATNPVVSAPAVSVTVDQEPSAPSIGTPTVEICTDQYTLDGVTPAVGTVSWSVVSVPGSETVTFDDATSPTAQASGLSGAGFYTLRMTTSNGVCADKDTDVSIENVGQMTSPNAGSDITICETDGTYSLSANTPPRAGETGTWTVSGPGSITDVNNAGATLTINGPITGTSEVITATWTIDNGGLCPDASDDVEITVDAEATTPNAGLADKTCTDAYTLAGNVATVGTGTWTSTSTPGGESITFDNANSETATASGLTGAGIYEFTWTIVNGTCTTTGATVDIDKTGQLTTPNAGADEGICENATYSLSGNTPLKVDESGSWTITGPATLDDATSATSGITITGQGTITATWTITNGTCPDASDDVVITVDPEPSTAVIAPAPDPCPDFITLSADPVTEGTPRWSVITGNASITQTGALTGMPQGQEVIVQYEVTSGVCTPSTATISLTSKGVVVPEVTMAVDGSSRLCLDGQSVSFTATPVTGGTGATYEWFAGGVSLGAPSTSPTFTATDKLVLLYEDITVKMISGDGCVTGSPEATSAPIQLDLVAPPVPLVNGTDRTICEDTPYTLLALGSGDVKWYRNNTLVQDGGIEYEINDVNEAGEYTVRMKNDVCPEVTSSNSVTIGVDQLPVISANASAVTLDEEEPLQLLGTATVAESVSWSNPNGYVVNPSSLITDVNTNEGGLREYTLTVTNGECEVEDKVTIIIYKKIAVPNVFSPQASPGHNDTWVIEGIETYPGHQVTVFNRWGASVFKSSLGDYQEWDGTRDGAQLPIGTYYYLIDLGKGKDPLTGTVTIIR